MGSENGCLWSNVGYSGAEWRIGGRSGREEVAAVFLGTHTPRLDEKGRLFLPARFRDELAGGLVITRGQGALSLRLAAPPSSSGSPSSSAPLR